MLVVLVVAANQNVHHELRISLNTAIQIDQTKHTQQGGPLLVISSAINGRKYLVNCGEFTLLFGAPCPSIYNDP